MIACHCPPDPSRPLPEYAAGGRGTEVGAGEQLVDTFRRWEAVAAVNDIESRELRLRQNNIVRTMSAVEAEELRRG